MYRQRPDMAISQKRKITITELTCPFETNFDKSHEFKARRYNNLRNALSTPQAWCSCIALIFLEISSLDFAGKMVKTFSKFLKELKLDDERIIDKYQEDQEVAVRTSYYIYYRRRKDWTDSELVYIYILSLSIVFRKSPS